MLFEPVNDGLCEAVDLPGGGSPFTESCLRWVEDFLALEEELKSGLDQALHQFRGARE